MNPRDSFGLSDLVFSGEDDDNAQALNEVLERARQKAMKDRIAEGKRKSEAANEAYNSLCDALGVKDLGGTIEGGAAHLRIPVSSIATIVSRIEALRASAVAEGAEVIAEGVL